MAMDILSIEYEQMSAIAQQFQGQSDIINHIKQAIGRDYQTLQTDWAGEAATLFFNEMQASIFPAFERLQAACLASQQVALNVTATLHEAEAEAARLFNGDFSASGAQGTGSPGDGRGIHQAVSLKNKHVTDPEYRVVAQPAFVKGAGDSDAVAMDDIRQGMLGDCYLMAGAAAIAKTRPDIIRNAIKDNGDGTYTVTLYPEDGVRGFFGVRSKVQVKVTNEFVHSKASGALGYAQLSNDSEIWPMLIEKAYAHYKGGYKNIERGNSGEFMAILTGNDSSDMDADDVNFSSLKKRLDHGDAVTAGTYDKLKNPPTYVHANHAYVVKDIDLANKKVILYNPWGHEHPTITFDEFKKNYEEVCINKK